MMKRASGHPECSHLTRGGCRIRWWATTVVVPPTAIVSSLSLLRRRQSSHFLFPPECPLPPPPPPSASSRFIFSLLLPTAPGFDCKEEVETSDENYTTASPLHHRRPTTATGR